MAKEQPDMSVDRRGIWWSSRSLVESSQHETKELTVDKVQLLREIELADREGALYRYGGRRRAAQKHAGQAGNLRPRRAVAVRCGESQGAVRSASPKSYQVVSEASAQSERERVAWRKPLGVKYHDIHQEA